MSQTMSNGRTRSFLVILIFAWLCLFSLLAANISVFGAEPVSSTDTDLIGSDGAENRLSTAMGAMKVFVAMMIVGIVFVIVIISINLARQLLLRIYLNDVGKKLNLMISTNKPYYLNVRPRGFLPGKRVGCNHRFNKHESRRIASNLIYNRRARLN